VIGVVFDDLEVYRHIQNHVISIMISPYDLSRVLRNVVALLSYYKAYHPKQQLPRNLNVNIPKGLTILYYGLDDPGFESQQGKVFSFFRKSTLALWLIQPPNQKTP